MSASKEVVEEFEIEGRKVYWDGTFQRLPYGPESLMDVASRSTMVEIMLGPGDIYMVCIAEAGEPCGNFGNLFPTLAAAREWAVGEIRERLKVKRLLATELEPLPGTEAANARTRALDECIAICDSEDVIGSENPAGTIRRLILALKRRS